jgi:hypothetical protein
VVRRLPEVPVRLPGDGAVDGPGPAHHIFGHDLFADPAQVPGYLELLGIDAHKPFECVGEVEESLVALSMLDDDGRGAGRVARGRPRGAWAAASPSEVLTPGGPTFVPPVYAKALAAAYSVAS